MGFQSASLLHLQVLSQFPMSMDTHHKVRIFTHEACLRTYEVLDGLVELA